MVVAPSAVCPMQHAQPRSTPKLQDMFARVQDAAPAAPIPLSGSGLPIALVPAWYAGALLCCAVLDFTWYAGVVVLFGWYAGAVI